MILRIIMEEPESHEEAQTEISAETKSSHKNVFKKAHKSLQRMAEQRFVTFVSSICNDSLAKR